ncbi:Aminobenzoyl-glutamate transport protein [Serratia liquefaciens]|nr:Aminobenzoyl-glutamate transport protein [Serratia liquefaciens]
MPLIIFFFFVVSLAYGIATGKIRRQADLPQLMIEPMKEMAGFIVMVFPLAQFVAMFNWSNMGKFMAVGLTDLLESSGMNGVPAFVGLALLSAFLCMFIASGSAIWSILAPIFVPMFMLLGFHRRLRRSCFVSLIHRCCRWRRCHRLCRCFSAFYSATGRMPASAPTIRWCSLTR